MVPILKCGLWQTQKHKDLILRSLSFFLKGYFCEFLLFQAQLWLQRGAFTLGQDQQRKREQSHRDNCTALWKLVFRQGMGINSHIQPFNLSIYSQSPSYIGLQNKLLLARVICHWCSSQVLDNLNCGLAEITNKTLKSELDMKCRAGIAQP